MLPINGARYTSCFCSRWGTFHWGIDLAAPMHTPEYAAGDGVVLRAGAASGFGLAVYILHENGDVTVYGHMDKILVEPGQYVEAGETIALLGNRGQSTGPHLHFEVHQGGENGKRINPIPWLAERGVDRSGRLTAPCCDRRREPRRRGVEPAAAARAGRDGPALRRAARRPDPGAHRARVRGALHPHVPRDVRRDAEPLPAAAPGRAGDVPAAVVGPVSVTDICMDVGFSSLGTFSRVFRDIVGEPPSRLPAARAAAAGAVLLRDGLAATEQFRRSTGGVSAPSVPAC